ncbi:hypothetical protein SEUCBS139899_000901 [Sporothrix eucalyptigena]|uniref:Carbohydrate esterase family 16 protein n=1 Tax=Sporothrix eucalyptigena TaxID=1812306 RepID=A0ABP0BJ61_9PEZI
MISRLACLLFASGAAAASLAASDSKYLFVFGDSYTSTGFSITGAKPSAANPLGNPALPGNTMAGGMTWVGHLATEHNTSLTLAYDFAVAGATVDNSIVAAFSSSIPSVVEQVGTFTKNLVPAPASAPWTADDALFAVWIGVNDVGNSYTKAAAAETALVNKDLDQYFAQLAILYKAGARHFALLNIPPTQKTPFMKGQSNVASLVTTITDWNGQLATRVATFVAANTEANVTLVDTQAPWNKAIANPTDYGATDATCVNANGKSCLWFNTYHPAQAIQKLVAQAVADAFKGTFF